MRAILSLIATVLLATTALAAEAPLTNNDVIKLVQAGLSADLVIAKIGASATDFDTSTNAMVALTEAKVPETVIRAMMAKAPAKAEPAAAVPVTPAPPAAAPTAAPAATSAATSDTTLSETPEVLAKDIIQTRGLCSVRGDLAVSKEGLRYTSTVAPALCVKYLSSASFGVRWDELKSICFEYALLGTIAITARDGRDYSIKDRIPLVKDIEKRLKTLRPDAPYNNCD